MINIKEAVVSITVDVYTIKQPSLLMMIELMVQICTQYVMF